MALQRVPVALNRFQPNRHYSHRDWLRTMTLSSMPRPGGPHAMNQRSFSIVSRTAVAIAMIAAGTSTVAAQEARADETVLLRTTRAWDGSRYRAYPRQQPEITVVRYTIPPHAVLPWHQHPSINVGYVLSGHLNAVRRSDGKRLALGPGDVVPEMVGGVHRGETGDEPAELIVFYAGAPGLPLTVSAGED
ncbi:cupin domain-containing protein [Burkholderia sp. IDO3]|uniref:cupin domain-containing protein n=1 Tax=Burkholderia sp. IDO3 TaxID=1705310 RepID=UPI001F07BC92|nr:cupin domain-containing protein [Burkholderia sp. IDO3]